MSWNLALAILALGSIFIIGLACGLRIEEHNLTKRERRLAEKQRQLEIDRLRARKNTKGRSESA
jgi:hypothetical protein